MDFVPPQPLPPSSPSPPSPSKYRMDSIRAILSVFTCPLPRPPLPHSHGELTENPQSGACAMRPPTRGARHTRNLPATKLPPPRRRRPRGVPKATLFRGPSAWEKLCRPAPPGQPLAMGKTAASTASSRWSTMSRFATTPVPPPTQFARLSAGRGYRPSALPDFETLRDLITRPLRRDPGDFTVTCFSR